MFDEDELVKTIANLITHNLPKPGNNREICLLAMALIASGQALLSIIIDEKGK
jgi:hypothetical protein